MSVMSFLGSLFGGGQQQPQQMNPANAAPLGTLPGVSPNVSDNQMTAPWSPPHDSFLRHAAGILGDAFLINSGHAPIYAPAYQERQMSSAMQNYGTDPMGAISNLTQVRGGVPLAGQLMNQYNTNQVALAKAGPEMFKNGMEGLADQAKGYGVLGGMGAALNANNYSAMLPIMQKFAAARGIDLPPAPPQFDQNWADTVQNSGLDAYRSIRADQFGQGLNIQQQNANTNQQNAGTNVRNADTRAAGQTSTANYQAGRLQNERDRGRPRRNVPLGGNPVPGSAAGGSSMPPFPPIKGHTSLDPHGNTWWADGTTWHQGKPPQ